MVFATTFIIPFFETSPKFLADFGESVLSVSLFISNFYFWLTSGYFGTTSELSPMLHTWSLAVEEQFYLIFPLLAVWFLPKGLKFFTFVLFILIILSLGAAEYGSRHYPIANFYLITGRAWELLLGSVAALALKKRIFCNFSSHLSSILTILGLGLIIASYITFSPSSAHPSLLTITPVFGTLLILLFCTNHCIIGKLLTQRVLVFVGLISYSLYLWHQPILALAKSQLSLHLKISNQLGLMVVIFIISYLSWKYVENPFRNKQRFSRRRVLLFAGISTASMMFLGLIFIQNIFLQKIISPENMYRYDTLLIAEQAHIDQSIYQEKCKFWAPEFNKRFLEKFDECANLHSKAIFILGGSHGIDLYNAVAKNTSNSFVVSVSKGYCRAHEMLEKDVSTTCQYEDFINFADQHANQISSIVYTQTPDRLFAKPMKNASKQDLSLIHVDQVVDYLLYFKNQHKWDVIMIGMLPPLLISPIDLDYKIDLEKQLNDLVSPNTLLMNNYADFIFAQKLAPLGIHYYAKTVAFGLELPSDILKSGQFTYSDKRHISEVGEDIFGKYLVNYLYERNHLDFVPIK